MLVSAVDCGGGAGFGTNVRRTPNRCFLLGGQPLILISELLPDLLNRDAVMSVSAEYRPGAGCCRSSGIVIVIFWPYLTLRAGPTLPGSALRTVPPFCSM